MLYKTIMALYARAKNIYCRTCERNTSHIHISGSQWECVVCGSQN